MDIRVAKKEGKSPVIKNERRESEGVIVVRSSEQSCWNCGFKVLPGRYCLKCGKKN
jgi:ribosomal protein L32